MSTATRRRVEGCACGASQGLRWVPVALAALVAAGSALAAPGAARAAIYQIQSSTMGDLSGSRRADGTDIIRRRAHQQLGLNAFDLLGDGSNQLYFVSSFRFSTDFGIEQRDLDANASLQTYDLALLYAYIEAKQLGGLVDMRLGRQYEIDAIDMVLFDGLRVRVDTPWYFGVEALGGIEARNRIGGVSTNPAELDGTLEREVQFDGSIRDTPVRAVYGAGLYLTDLAYTQLDVKFRRIQTLDGSGDVNQQRVGAAFQQRIIEGLHINGSASYDFFLSLLNEARGGIRYRPVHLFEIEASYAYLIPTFDADSIFNVFSWRPMNRATERVRFFFGDDLWAYVGSYQSFVGADNSVTPEDVEGLVSDIGVTVGGRWVVGSQASVGAEFSTQRGYGGDQTFVDAGGQYWFLDGELGADLRLLLAIFDDEQQDRLDGTMFGAQLSGTWRFSELGQVQLLVEHATTQLQPSWMRVFAVVSFDAAL